MMAADSVGYRVMIHQGALRELQTIDPEVARDLRERVLDAATHRQPKTLPCVGQLAGYPHLLKVRGDGVRAICRLVEPELQVLLVGKRRTVYERLDVAERRAAGGAD